MPSVFISKQLKKIFFILLLLVIPTLSHADWTWTEQTGSGNRLWYSIAASSDNTKLVAVTSSTTGGEKGDIYTSTDSGVTWTSRNKLSYWSSVASSSDGIKLVAVSQGEGASSTGAQIYTSTDSGATWTARESNRVWRSVASSSDGTKLAAVAHGYIYTSTDSGATWTEQTSSGSRYWYSISSSSDGIKLVAATQQSTSSNGQIYTSTDSGVTWKATGQSGNWTAVVSSSDGKRLAAVAYGGYVYTSTDSGVTWTEQTSAGSRYWYSITSSSDGVRLTAGVTGGYIYTSTDSGGTWTEQKNAGSRNWFTIASSSDGTKLVAGAYGGYIYTGVYTSSSTSTTTTTTSLTSGNSTTTTTSLTSDNITSTTKSKVTYFLPYFHTNTNNVTYCVISNISTDNVINIYFSVGANSSGTPTGAQKEFISTKLFSKMSKLMTFSDQLIYFGNDTMDISSELGLATSYAGTLTFNSTGTGLSCKNILMACFQGTTNPKRNLAGFICEDNSSVGPGSKKMLVGF